MNWSSRSNGRDPLGGLVLSMFWYPSVLVVLAGWGAFYAYSMELLALGQVGVLALLLWLVVPLAWPSRGEPHSLVGMVTSCIAVRGGKTRLTDPRLTHPAGPVVSASALRVAPWPAGARARPAELGLRGFHSHLLPRLSVA